MTSTAVATSHSDFFRDRDLDPITFSVLLNNFSGIVEEMTLTLEHTAWTSVLALARDYSCAIYDSKFRQICMHDALPVHTASLDLVLRAIAQDFTEDVHDGDVFVCNDPYRGNTHVGDVVIAAPIFDADTHEYWTVARAHHLDVGGMVSSSMTPNAANVWQEGLHLPPMRLVSCGDEVGDVMRMILANVRYPDLQEGDLRAQLASVWAGGARLREAMTEMGAKELSRYVDAILDYADRRMQAEIERLGNGMYEATTWIDSDGSGKRDLAIVARVTIEAGRAHVDFSSSSQQTSAGTNGSLATSRAAATIPFLALVDADIPRNHGCIKHVTMHADEGTICVARHPAATSLATIVPTDAMHDAVHMALATANGGAVAAGGARASSAPSFSGLDETTNRLWSVMLFNNAGGFPASRWCDGWPLYGGPSAMGGLKCLSIEQIELLYPLHVEEMTIAIDSMGVGQTIGGPGVRLVVRPTGGPVTCVTVGDGYHNPPTGVMGGTAGAGGGQFIEGDEDGARLFISANGEFTIATDERRVGISSGGGGYGNPLLRDIDQVRRDVRDGLISPTRAREMFGVVLSESFDPVVDNERTKMERAGLGVRMNARVTPLEPSASAWLSANRRHGDVYLVDPVGASRASALNRR